MLYNTNFEALSFNQNLNNDRQSQRSNRGSSIFSNMNRPNY